MISIIDYGVGNLFSLSSSLKFIGAEVSVTSSAEDIAKSDKLFLPGVGAFADAAKKLKESGLFDVIKKEAAGGKPLFGICLGMQMLFETSYEYGKHPGLGLIKGSVVSIEPIIQPGLKIPHIGWNALCFPKSREKSPVFKHTNEGDHVYFVHSYHGDGAGDSVTATTEYGGVLTAAVGCGSVYGTQFHPEKSGDVGLNILRAFCEI